jgi:carnitine O-acetyltransferase
LDICEPIHLKFLIDSEIKRGINEAERNAKQIIRNCDVGVLIYNGYGHDDIRKYIKTSPDAVVQMALQLAFYRIHGTPPPTYETGSTRRFIKGRTETIRSCSVDSFNFIRSFNNSTPLESYKALLKACKAHVSYTLDAISGNGIDRHLLGLKICLKPNETHEIFYSALIAKGTYYRLSSSSLSEGNGYEYNSRRLL